MRSVCPRCEDEDLRDAPHGASVCAHCHGIFVPRDRMFELVATEWPGADTALAAPVTPEAALCPVDHTIMTRATIELADGTAVSIDRCSSCLGAWFDAGEWDTLARAHFFDHFDEIWSAEWRARQRRAHDAREYQKHEREELGPELYDQLVEIAHALRGNPRRSQALAFLREESKR